MVSEPLPNRGRRVRSGRARVGQMSETRESWVDMPKFTAILFVDDAEDWIEWKGDRAPEYEPDCPPVKVQLAYHGQRRPTSFNLTSMTAPELESFRQFWERAFELAKPICELMDTKAREAFEAGDDSFARLYRPVPRLFIRDELQSEHSKGIQERPPRLIDRIAEELAAGVHEPADGGSAGNDPASDEIASGEGSGIVPPGDGSGMVGEHPQP